MQSLRSLLRYRELLVAWIARDVKVRYKQTVLGVAWAVLQPLLLMLAFTFVFGMLVSMPLQGDLPYPVFVYTGLLVWTFTASSLSFGVTSLTRNTHVLTTVYFPREILPAGSVAASGVDFALAAIVGALLLAFYRIPISIHILWVPIIAGVQVLLTLGLALWVSAAHVFWRDLHFIVPLALQLWFYASPIVYPAQLVPAAWYSLYALNPMVGIVTSYRAAVLQASPPDLGALSIAAAISLVVFLSGYVYFKRKEMEFADVV